MKPILFSEEMVKAILDGRKTVTRRCVREPYYIHEGFLTTEKGICMHRGTKATFGMPYQENPYDRGDILYVRETWNCLPIPEPLRGTSKAYWYKADGEKPGDKWRPSIHMPREAARIFLLVKNVRAERLQDIQERGQDGAQAEGFVNDIDIASGGGKSATKHFTEFWDKKIKPEEIDLYGWNANPWVWVIEFERITKEEAEKAEGEKIQ